MKIKVTEIEATAQELRASNDLAGGVANLLRGVFNPFSDLDLEPDPEPGADDEQ